MGNAATNQAPKIDPQRSTDPNPAGFMEVGQHIIALLLTAVAVFRAISAGSSPVAVAIVGIAILVWDAFGARLHPAAKPPVRAEAWLLGLAGIWLIAVIVSPEFIWLAFLLWLLAGRLLPLVWGLLFSAAVLAVAIGAPLYFEGSTTYANILGPLIGSIFTFGISRGYLHLLDEVSQREQLVESLTLAQQEMAALQDELTRAQRESGAAAERQRISRDLHDTVAQSLSSVRFLAHAGAAKTTDPESAATFGQVGVLAAESLTDVRRIVAALTPAELDEGALAAALSRLLKRTEGESGLQLTLQVDDSLPALPTDVEVALLRTAQSGLANVRKHAGAKSAVLSLIDEGDAVRLDLVDDGHGFDVAAWDTQHESTSYSFGLRFMRQRLRELGGGLVIESAPGEGTAISAHIPLHSPPVTSSLGAD